MKRSKSNRQQPEADHVLPDLTARERGKLMARTGLSLNAIDRWWRGHPVHASTHIALARAARSLKMVVPMRKRDGEEVRA